jgi:biotin carboxylase
MTLPTQSKRHSAATRSRKHRTPNTVLRSVESIRQYFADRERKVYFVSASNFNMIGMHRWVQGWHNINMLDCFDGTHPASTVVKDDHARLFGGIEDVNHYLLDNAVVQDLLQSRADVCRARGLTADAPKDQVLFLFFDEALEEKCRKLGLDVALPPNRLVREVDSKLVTTDIGNAAGVASVPNVMASVGNYAELRRIADDAGLGPRLVVQAAYGDSGKTTYFIDSEEDYAQVAAHIESQQAVKVMRRVRCVGTAIEACATRWGTVVGPLLTELIGREELTPYAGGWCGNENYAVAFTPDLRAQVQHKTQAFGRELYARGYRGTFELDYLLDLDTGEVYLGELNSRITGVTALTNTSDFSRAQLPLFLFHLLEFDGYVDLRLDLEAFNAAMLAQGAEGTASQIILKHTDCRLKVIEKAPVSGVYRLSREGLVLKAAGVDREAAKGPDEAFLLRIQGAGEYAYKGGDMAILFMNTTIAQAQGELSTQGQRWTQALKNSFVLRELSQEERTAIELAHNPANVKSARD